MVQPIPAPSLRELSSEARLRECTSVNVTAQNYRVYMRWWETVGMEEPSGYTPSVTPIRACQLPQGGSREGRVPFNVPPGNRNVAGDFHRPYEDSETGSFYHSSGDTPSVTPGGRDSSLREGAGGGAGTIQRAAQKAEGYGRFSSPLRRLRMFYRPKTSGF